MVLKRIFLVASFVLFPIIINKYHYLEAMTIPVDSGNQLSYFAKPPSSVIDNAVYNKFPKSTLDAAEGTKNVAEQSSKITSDVPVTAERAGSLVKEAASGAGNQGVLTRQAVEEVNYAPNTVRGAQSLIMPIDQTENEAFHTNGEIEEVNQLLGSTQNEVSIMENVADECSQVAKDAYNIAQSAESLFQRANKVLNYISKIENKIPDLVKKSPINELGGSMQNTVEGMKSLAEQSNNVGQDTFHLAGSVQPLFQQVGNAGNSVPDLAQKIANNERKQVGDQYYTTQNKGEGRKSITNEASQGRGTESLLKHVDTNLAKETSQYGVPKASMQKKSEGIKNLAEQYSNVGYGAFDVTRGAESQFQQASKTGKNVPKLAQKMTSDDNKQIGNLYNAAQHEREAIKSITGQSNKVANDASKNLENKVSSIVTDTSKNKETMNGLGDNMQNKFEGMKSLTDVGKDAKSQFPQVNKAGNNAKSAEVMANDLRRQIGNPYHTEVIGQPSKDVTYEEKETRADSLPKHINSNLGGETSEYKKPINALSDSVQNKGQGTKSLNEKSSKVANNVFNSKKDGSSEFQHVQEYKSLGTSKHKIPIDETGGKDAVEKLNQVASGGSNTAMGAENLSKKNKENTSFFKHTG